MSHDVGQLLARLAADAAAAGTPWDFEQVSRGYRARCPNPDHADRHPSWTIVDDPGSDRHGSHHCMSCHFGGGPWELAAAIWGVGLLEAGKRLGDGGAATWTPPARESLAIVPSIRSRPEIPIPAGVRVPTTPDEWHSDYASYLERRGVPLVQAISWGLGYAASGPLAGRVWVPVRDGLGRLQAWSAREALGHADHVCARCRLADHAADIKAGRKCACGSQTLVRRYLEATAQVCAACGSPRYERSLRAGRACGCGSRRLVQTFKTRSLFGLHRVSPDSRVTVCEGTWSCLALERTGWPNCIALLGSDLLGGRGASSRVHRLGSFAGPVYVLTDPDPAGDRVADDLRVLDGYQGVSRRVVRVRLSVSPDDADERELRDALLSCTST